MKVEDEEQASPARAGEGRTGRVRIAILAAVLAVAGIGALALLSTAEVVDEGYGLRPYDSGKVYEIELAGSFTIYADEESRLASDLLTGSALIALAAAAGMAYLLLRAARGRRRLLLFYGLAAAGFAFLAVDELLAVHETVGHNLLFLSDVPGVDRPDDALYALYAVPALAFVVYFRDVLVDSTWAARLFGGAVAAFLCAGVADLAGLGIDELIEPLVALLIASGFLSLIATHLSGPRFAGQVAETSD